MYSVFYCFNYDWNLKITNWKQFGVTTIKTLDDAIEKLHYEGIKLQFYKYCIECNDEVKMIA